ncbi:MAG: rRNA maturation RNase YbeY [Bacteroidales bacterium]|nr:rRNA maturation RNase YbeY [Bacteroidales bacterium]
MSNIQFHYINRKPTINEKDCSNWITLVANEEGSEINEVNFVFCSDDYLLDINKDHLNRNYYTDVISFYYNDEPGEIYGDVFISVDRVEENARRYVVKMKDEMDRIIVHGILHLIGYGDTSEAEKALMTERENLYLGLRK